MWVTLIRVYAAKAIDNEYAYGRLNAEASLESVGNLNPRLCRESY